MDVTLRDMCKTRSKINNSLLCNCVLCESRKTETCDHHGYNTDATYQYEVIM